MRLKIDQTPLQIISSQRGCVHAGEYVVFQDFPHLRPSSENQLKVTEAVKFLEIHGSVQVLVGRFHKRLKDHPGEYKLKWLISWPWKGVEDGEEMLIEGVGHLRRFSKTRQALHKVLQTQLMVAGSCCKELEKAKKCFVYFCQAQTDCVNPVRSELVPFWSIDRKQIIPNFGKESF